VGDACLAPEHDLRVHLPVAGRCNARAINGAGPCVCPILSPLDALAFLKRVTDEAKGRAIAMVAVCGPGDPLASPEETLAALRLVRQTYPGLSLCIGVNGIGGEPVAKDLADVGLDHVTLYVNAVDPAVAAKLYQWIRPSKRTLPVQEAAVLLVEEQKKSLVAFKEAGLTVKVDITIFPGLNEEHALDVAKAMADLGADCLELTPCAPVPASENGPGIEAPDAETLERLRKAATAYLPVTTAPDACSAGGVVALQQDAGPKVSGEDFLNLLPKPDAQRPYVAVASTNGFEINEHLGRAQRFLIYGPKDGMVSLLDARPGPLPGSGDERWETLADSLPDCKLLLVEHAGQNPEQVLAHRGIRIVRVSGNIESIVDSIYGGGKKGRGRNK
jgi:nitrogen fixation protein NifB